MPNLQHSSDPKHSNATTSAGGGENSNTGGSSTVTVPLPGTEASAHPIGADVIVSPSQQAKAEMELL